MMDHAVTERGGGDQARLGIENLKAAVAPWLVGFLL
jgi:hypothetical protein